MTGCRTVGAGLSVAVACASAADVGSSVVWAGVSSEAGFSASGVLALAADSSRLSGCFTAASGAGSAAVGSAVGVRRTRGFGWGGGLAAAAAPEAFAFGIGLRARLGDQVGQLLGRLILVRNPRLRTFTSC